MKITTSRKEDEYYFQGPFWIVADKFIDVLRGNFDIIGEKYLSDINGEYLDSGISKSARTHKNVWKTKYALDYSEDDFTYYPRGRVSIYQGIAFIHINSKCNIPKVIDKIISEYGLQKLEIEVDLNDTYQGSHYDFKLR